MMRLFLALTLPLYLADQLTKWLVLARVGRDEVIPVIPGFFNLVHVYNTGAAFGMMKDNNLFFVIISGIALVVIAVLCYRGVFADSLSKVGAALLVSGILGNLTDRILHGHVIDFLDFILPWYGRWPAFNIADSCIFVAAGLFILSSLLDGKRAPNAQGSTL